LTTSSFDIPLLAQAVEVLHQVADGEVRRVALAAVAVLAAVLERVGIRHVEGEDLVADAAERRLDEQVVRHRQAGDQDRGVLALVARERARNLVEPLLGGFDREAEALALLDLEVLQLCLDRLHGHCIEVGTVVVVRGAHVMSPRVLVATCDPLEIAPAADVVWVDCARRPR
jgi:hypothetical protein